MPGLFSFDVALAQQVVQIFTAIDQDVNQYKSQIINLVGQLESSWQSPNKASFYNDWGPYCNALLCICDTGPRLVNGLNHEITYVTDAEQVQF